MVLGAAALVPAAASSAGVAETFALLHALLSAPAGVAETVAGGSLVVAVPLAALAGLLSFASPCVLPLVPGYLSYATGLVGSGMGQQPARAHATDAGRSPERDAGAATRTTLPVAPPRPGRSQILLGTAGFIAGFSAVFVSYGALFGGLGASLVEHQAVLTRLLGAVVIVLGLGYLGLVPALQRDVRLHRRPARGLWAAPVLGVLFGLGWTPCIGPTLAAVQGLAFTEGSAARGALLSVAYCVGLGLPFLLAGLAMDRGLSALSWARRRARGIQMAGGLSLVVLGLLMVSGVWGSLMVAVRGWVSGWSVAL
jgi:cytochrome c-type biogenesis protein